MQWETPARKVCQMRLAYAVGRPLGLLPALGRHTAHLSHIPERARNMPAEGRQQPTGLPHGSDQRADSMPLTR